MSEKIVYKELSYQIVGVLFEVFNELGFGYKEYTYEKAAALGLDERAIKYERQVSFPIKFKGNSIGRQQLDFLIEDKVVLELKKGNYFSKQNIDQVNQYLQVTGKKLAILANFTSTGVNYKRLVTIK